MQNEMESKGLNKVNKITNEQNFPRGDFELMDKEKTLTREQKLEKIFSFKGEALGIASKILGNLGNDADFEDIVDEATINAIKHIGEFRHNSTLKTWFKRIVFNQTLDFLRKQKAQKISQMPTLKNTDGKISEIEIPDNHPDPEQLYEKEEQKKLLRSAIFNLRPIFRTCLILTTIEGMNNQEAADALGIPLPTFKSRLSRGEKELKKKIQKLKI
jgi:RNA polymerase sigma-70 factor (ECF subfamily)